MRLDEKSVVPLGWVLSGMSVVIAGTVVGVFWVSTVNFRLQRIEEKLGIPEFHAESISPRGINEALANEKPRD